MAESIEEKKSGYGAGYGKRPFWQWVVIYVIVGGALYAGIYYVFLANKGGYGNGTSTPPYSTPTDAAQPQPSTTPSQYPTQ